MTASLNEIVRASVARRVQYDTDLAVAESFAVKLDTPTATESHATYRVDGKLSNGDAFSALATTDWFEVIAISMAYILGARVSA